MLDLALSVLCSSLIFVVFKLYDRFKVHTLYAIIFNYITACVTGLLLYEKTVNITEIVNAPWLWGTLALGVLFILIFRIMAKSSQLNGVGVTSVATKMSLVIPVVFALLVYKEKLSILQIVGILMALAAVYFASLKKGSIAIQKNSLLLPTLVFLGSGVIDTSIKYLQETQLRTEEYPVFSATVFAAAATTGIVFVSLRSFVQRPKIHFKDVLGGIALGIPNYFSIFFLLRALRNDALNSSSIFTINNVAIVMFSTLLGILLFKERLSIKNWGGIALAVISILLVALF
ncbi:DMT family transporter [Allomuricauda sp. d1]|uniref:DMT family transporter n=1 Tax=Allomuricauda sp. d1 TaxID=3136725 RepID=UPI0031DA22B7